MPSKKTVKPISDITSTGKTAPELTSKSIITHRAIIKDGTALKNEATDQSETNDSPAPSLTQHHLTPLTAPLLKPVDVLKASVSKKSSGPDSEATINVADLPDAPSIDELKARRSHQLTKKLATPATPDPVEPAEPAQPEAEQPKKKVVTKPAPPVETKAPDPAQKKAETPVPAVTEAKESIAPKHNVQKDDSQVETKDQLKVSLEKHIEAKTYFLPINSVEKRKAKRFVVAGILLSLLLIVAWANIALDAGIISLPGIKPVTHFFST